MPGLIVFSRITVLNTAVSAFLVLAYLYTRQLYVSLAQTRSVSSNQSNDYSHFWVSYVTGLARRS